MPAKGPWSLALVDAIHEPAEAAVSAERMQMSTKVHYLRADDCARENARPTGARYSFLVRGSDKLDLQISERSQLACAGLPGPELSGRTGVHGCTVPGSVR